METVTILHMNPTEPLIILRDAARAVWLYFEKPHEIVSVSTLSDVLPALQRIEQLVEAHGWYAAGFLSYEAAPAFDSAFITRAPSDVPLLWFGLYDEPRTSAVLTPTDAAFTLETWEPSVTRPAYGAAIDQIKEHIARGNTYQVNYTFRLTAGFHGEPWSLFTIMLQTQPVNYPAYIQTGRHIICCASPELFFALNGKHITCRPMKGTALRGRTLTEDRAQAEALRTSPKQRAENVMIVDMLRNDLGRIAHLGSVRVPVLFETERYRTLWQMTSTVTAQVDAPFHELMAALFPCASITGAPKVSTMGIIAALETAPRGIYTGTIGFLAPRRRAQFNVAIRTAVINYESGQAEYGVGGGIVWDSTAGDEYAESLLKAKAITAPQAAFSLLETLRWTPPEGWLLREAHLSRLGESAEYFGFPFDRAMVEARLTALEKNFTGPQRVRLLLSPDGVLKDEAVTLPSQSPAPLRVQLAAAPVDDADIFLYHKTTRRSVYEQARTARPACDDVLLYNQRDELTEFTIGNLVVELDGNLFTPPITCGLLPGTFRADLLARNLVRERVLHREDLARCTKIFLVNSVREWVETKLIEQ